MSYRLKNWCSVPSGGRDFFLLATASRVALVLLRRKIQGALSSRV
jgi:hypothetical protein